MRLNVLTTNKSVAILAQAILAQAALPRAAPRLCGAAAAMAEAMADASVAMQVGPCATASSMAVTGVLATLRAARAAAHAASGLAWMQGCSQEARLARSAEAALDAAIAMRCASTAEAMQGRRRRRGRGCTEAMRASKTDRTFVGETDVKHVPMLTELLSDAGAADSSEASVGSGCGEMGHEATAQIQMSVKNTFLNVQCEAPQAPDPAAESAPGRLELASNSEQSMDDVRDSSGLQMGAGSFYMGEVCIDAAAQPEGLPMLHMLQSPLALWAEALVATEQLASLAADVESLVSDKPMNIVAMEDRVVSDKPKRQLRAQVSDASIASSTAASTECQSDTGCVDPVGPERPRRQLQAQVSDVSTVASIGESVEHMEQQAVMEGAKRGKDAGRELGENDLDEEIVAECGHAASMSSRSVNASQSLPCAVAETGGEDADENVESEPDNGEEPTTEGPKVLLGSGGAALGAHEAIEAAEAMGLSCHGKDDTSVGEENGSDDAERGLEGEEANSDVEGNDDPALETYLCSLEAAFLDDPVDVDSIKKHYAIFLRARLAQGIARSTARQAAMGIVRDFKAARVAATQGR